MAKKKHIKGALSEKELYKKFPGMMLASQIEKPLLRIPSSCLGYTYQIGGGIPYGKILEAHGEESSGKSMMAYDFAYVTHQLGGVVLWNDAEQAWQNDWAENNGLDLSRTFVFASTAVEEVSDWFAATALMLRSKLTHNEPILFVQDSLAGLDCYENLNSEMVEARADMGNRAKAIYKMLRIRNEMMASLGVTQIYINQLRKNLKAGMFENPDTTPGGQAMKFYASIRSAFYGGKAIKEKHKGKERRVGRYTSIRGIKNKTAPPRETLKATPMYFNPKYHTIGFDQYHGLDDILVDADIVERSSAGVFKYKGKTLCRGGENFKKLLEEDEKLRNKLLKKAEINTIESTKKVLEGLNGTNLFPVEGITYKPQIEEEDEDDE